MNDIFKGKRPRKNFKGGPFYKKTDKNGKVVIPEELPLFFKKNVKINSLGEVENLSEFKDIDDIFNFASCLGCFALQEECYGSVHETPCMKCEVLVSHIKTVNKNDPKMK